MGDEVGQLLAETCIERFLIVGHKYCIPDEYAFEKSIVAVGGARLGIHYAIGGHIVHLILCRLYCFCLVFKVSGGLVEHMSSSHKCPLIVAEGNSVDISSRHIVCNGSCR